MEAARLDVVGSEAEPEARLGVGLLAAAAAVSALAVTAAILRVLGGSNIAQAVLLLMPAAGFLLVGTLVAARRPSNPIGPILIGQALLIALIGFADSYARYSVIDDPGSLPAAQWATLWADSAWPTYYVGLVAAMLVFPNGHLPTPRWRRVAIGAAVSFAGLIAVLLVLPEPFAAPFENEQRPLPTLPVGAEPLIAPFWLGMLASLFAAAWAIRIRFRRAVGGERLQLFWIAYGALFIPATLLICGSDYAISGGASAATGIAIVVMSLVIPATIGIAILRYRLFDIELILSRTLLYGFLTAAVIAIYVIVVGGLSFLVPSRGLLGLGATGLVAVGIQPLRLRVQGRVDRFVYGDRDDPYVALSRLGDRLQATLAPEAVSASIVAAVAEALRVSFVAIEFERKGVFEIVASRGSERDPAAQADTALVYQGQQIGRLVVEPPPGRQLSTADRRLLSDLARHAGVALHGVRLTSDLQHSRERLVTTREEERRRLRRDLHDSLGPTLAGMAFTLDAARNLIETDPEGAAEAIGALRSETQEAISDIRRVAHDLRPPALDELGFVAAIRTYAERLNAGGNGNALRVRVAAPDPFPEMPAAVEVAGYRIVLEALTNVTRHAGARDCLVELTPQGEELQITVADDGGGIESARGSGVGLGSMRERAAELGGRLEIGARPTGGTRVFAALPVGAQR